RVATEAGLRAQLAGQADIAVRGLIAPVELAVNARDRIAGGGEDMDIPREPGVLDAPRALESQELGATGRRVVTRVHDPVGGEKIALALPGLRVLHVEADE